MDKLLTIHQKLMPKDHATDDDDEDIVSYEELSIINNIPCDSIEGLKALNDTLVDEKPNVKKMMV